MKRIDTVYREEDLFGTGKDGFREGVIESGVKATRLGADWPNGVQEELMKIIETAGLTPDGDDNGQVLKALTILLGRPVDMFPAITANRMFAGTLVASPAASTIRVAADNRIVVGGYWFAPVANLDLAGLAISSSGGAYLHRTGFDGDGNPTWAVINGAADGAAEFTWSAGVRTLVNGDKFFLCNWATDGAGVVTLTNKAQPLTDDALAMPIGIPVPWVKKGASDALPANWLALTGGTVDEPRSPFDGATMLTMTSKFARGAAAAAVIASTPSGGADTHDHGGDTDTAPYVTTTGYDVAQTTPSINGSVANHYDNVPTLHKHDIDPDGNVPAYLGFQYVMRIY